jgi:arylsulfatase A-like enzyme
MTISPNFISLFSLVTILVAPLSAEESRAWPERPNIIYVMVDDLGYGDLGCFGQQRIATPNVDQLARDGMKLTNYYAGCTVCRPSRLTLWTGQHTGHTAINSNATYVFKSSDVTVAELVKTQRYVTGGVGKWAMGGVDTTGHPNRNGFDYWMGYLDQGQAHNYYPEYLWLNSRQVPLLGNRLSDHPMSRGRVSQDRVTYSHDVMTDHLLDFVRINHTQPFLCHVHWTIPHANNEGGRVTGDGMEVPDYGDYADRDWPTTAKGQAAMISRMDRDFGRLIDLLHELDIHRRTLVIFTSDNGPHSEGGHNHEYFDSNGPLRGFKRDLYEGGIRVPMIACWPGVIKPNTISHEPHAFWDFMPTVCQLTGAATPEGIDGVSLMPTLLGKPRQGPAHESLFWRYGDKVALRRGDWKIVQTKKGQAWELYNLSNDIGETIDLALKHPDTVKELVQLALQSEK